MMDVASGVGGSVAQTVLVRVEDTLGTSATRDVSKIYPCVHSHIGRSEVEMTHVTTDISMWK